MHIHHNTANATLLIAFIIFHSAFVFAQKYQKQEKLYEILVKTVSDYDGNVYGTVKIGDQIWMLENLKVTHYKNGIPIPKVHNNDQWSQSYKGAYCLVNDDINYYKQTFGALYNYYTVTNNNILCPEGWHVPTKEECLTLINYLGGNETVGEKIKDNSQNLWRSGNDYATNESGFSGLPAGGRGKYGSAGEVGYYATWWSSTSTDKVYAWHWGVYPDKKGIRSNPGHKLSGFSVRCIKD